eukprot:14446-Heterococcus_DN1.PRE.3
MTVSCCTVIGWCKVADADELCASVLPQWRQHNGVNTTGHSLKATYEPPHASIKLQRTLEMAALYHHNRYSKSAYVIVLAVRRIAVRPSGCSCRSVTCCGVL